VLGVYRDDRRSVSAVRDGQRTGTVICDVHGPFVRTGSVGVWIARVHTVVIARPEAAGACVEPFPSALSRDGASVRWGLILAPSPT